jgi:hypothetical protein
VLLRRREQNYLVRQTFEWNFLRSFEVNSGIPTDNPGNDRVIEISIRQQAADHG